MQQNNYALVVPYELLYMLPTTSGLSFLRLAASMDKVANCERISYSQLQKLFGVCKKTAIKHIAEMEKAGLIQVHRLHLPGKKFAEMNTYSLTEKAQAITFRGIMSAGGETLSSDDADSTAKSKMRDSDATGISGRTLSTDGETLSTDNSGPSEDNVHRLSLIQKEEEDLDSNLSPSNLLEDATSKRTAKSNDAAGENADTAKTETKKAYPAVVMEVFNSEQIENQLKTNSLERIIEACEYAMSRDDISSKAGYAWKILSKSDPIPKAKKRKAKRSIDGSISSKEDFFSGKYGKHLKWWMERTPEERYQTGSYLFEMSPERQAELHARCERINKVRAAKRKAFYAGDYGEKVREICKQAFTETSKGYWMLEQLEAYADPDDAETLIVRVRDDNVRMLMNMVRGRIMEGLPEFKDVVFHINRLTHLEPLSVDKFANMREEIRRDLEKKELGEVAENSA